MTDKPPWETSANQPEVRLSQNPTGAEEEDTLFLNPEEKARRQLLNRRLELENEQFERDISNRQEFAENAYGLTQSWIGMLFVLTFCQFGLKPLGYSLSQAEFITVFTSTTVAVFGFWVLVGRYLFKAGDGDKKAKKPTKAKATKKRDAGAKLQQD